MIEFAKKHSGIILLCGVFTVVGILMGLFCQADKNGVYISLKSNDNEIVVGQTQTSLKDYNMHEMTASEAKLLSTKISELTPEKVFSKELIYLKSKRIGPFEPVDIENVIVEFSDDSSIIDGFASACKKSDLYGIRVATYNISSNNKKVIKNDMREFTIIDEPKRFTLCKGKQSKHIWVSKNIAKEWLGINNEQDMPKNVQVTARILDYM